MMPLLEIRGMKLDIAAQDTVLHPVRGVDLTLMPGETLAIVGESGCGKSLTAMAIMGLLPRNARLSADRLALGGKSLLGLSDRQWRAIRGRRIAMIFQDPMTAFDPCYRIGDQMLEILRQHRPDKADKAHLAAMLARVGISAPDERLHLYPHQLSGGIRQRVMIALALLCEPELIIADEPTTALDVTIQTQILRLLADIQQETGVGLILITHDLGVVAGMADRTLVMYGGEVVESGVTDVVIGAPRHPYTEGLMQSIPAPGKGDRRTPLGFIPGTVPRPVGERDACGFLARCPYRLAACAAGPVPLRDDGSGHAQRCVLPLDGAKRDPALWSRAKQGELA